MDGSGAIERNRVALKRIVASLVAMAGLDAGPDPEVRADPALAEGAPRRAAVPSTSPQEQAMREGRRSPDRRVGVLPNVSRRLSYKEEKKPGPTLPRHLWRAILRLLRPAEAAARRLIIAAARGLVVSLPKPRERKPKPVAPEQFLRSLGIAVRMTPAEMARAAAEARRAAAAAERARAPARPRSFCLPLLDPLRTPEPVEGRRGAVPAHAVPRILLPGMIEPHRLPPLPSPDDAVSAARLNQRLAALAAALDDLPGQALRFARWKARRDLGLGRRISPLRPGRPPGGRLTRFDPAAFSETGEQGKRPSRKIREVDEILAHAHSLALAALERPDTS